VANDHEDSLALGVAGGISYEIKLASLHSTMQRRGDWIAASFSLEESTSSEMRQSFPPAVGPARWLKYPFSWS